MPAKIAHNNKMNVLFISAEADPLIKVGGLGDVAGSLPQALLNISKGRQASHRVDIRLVIPYYPAIKSKGISTTLVGAVKVQGKQGTEVASVYETQSIIIPTYLIDGEPIRNSEKVYSADMAADGRKFTFFSLAALELPNLINWKLDILHANDWHTSTSVYGLTFKRSTDNFLSTASSVLTVHNLPFMGAGTGAALDAYNLPPSQDGGLPDWARQIPLPLGLCYADAIVPVSPTYAKEILTPGFGCNLETFLATRAQKITGILNGIDIQTWNPSTDPLITRNYSQRSLNLRKKNKSAIRSEFELEDQPDIPLFILISRLDQQKGVDLALDALSVLSDLPWQVIILGTGDPVLESAATRLTVQYKDRVRLALRFDSPLSHRLYSSGDMILMPSRYEPCGLAQMIAMRYGCVPVVRATGGLADTVTDATDPDHGTGFLCYGSTPADYAQTLRQAIDYYHQKDRWAKLQINGMQSDFSWHQSAKMYLDIYLKLKGNKP